jgi:hypothetical protein
MDLIDLYIIFHPTAEEYTFSVIHGTFFKTNQILGNKASLKKQN